MSDGLSEIALCENAEPHGQHEWLDGVRRRVCPGIPGIYMNPYWIQPVDGRYIVRECAAKIGSFSTKKAAERCITELLELDAEEFKGGYPWPNL